ncbi:MAG: transposase domain-containing protein [Planctomycetes bacterium]|nr:transposase domain-containing protein [Planctomycetota bacterium]
MIASCKDNRVDPFAYFVDVLSCLPEDPIPPAELLPNRWLKTHPETRFDLNRSR